MMIFAIKLKEYREKKGYKQQEIADLLGVMRQSVSKWENGHSRPDYELLGKLFDLYDVTGDEIKHFFTDEK